MKITFTELEKKLIDSYRKNQDYSMLPIHFGNTSNRASKSACDVLIELYDEIPEHQKYKVVFDVYKNVKQPTKYLLDSVLDVKKYRPDKILDPLKELADPSGNLVIYRGSGKKEQYPQYSLSWTLNRDTAVFFARNYPLTQTRTNVYYVYRGEINIFDVLYYSNDRDEFEVIQYKSVKNIQIEKQLVKVFNP